MFRRLAATTTVVAASPTQALLVQQRNRSLGPFGVFLKQCYADKVRTNILGKIHPAVPGRAQMIGNWYRALPEKEIAKLTATGKKMKIYRKKPTQAEKKEEMKKKGLVRAPSAYNKFVKKQSKTNKALKGLPIQKRMKKIAQLWNMMK